MKAIDEDIKNGNFRSVYLLYGEENYLKRQYRDKLKNAIVRPEDNVNFSAFEGKNISQGELIDLAETLPFFAPRRMILVENSGFFKNSAPELSDYLKTVPETTCFLFVEEEVDRRSKMYKAAKHTGSVVAFERQKEDVLIRWISGRIRRENKNITNQAMKLFLSMTGGDMDNIDRELEKLLCYCMERDAILPVDVEAVCCGQIQNRIFDMVNAIALGELQKALRLYYDLLELKEPPMRILFLLARQFQNLLHVKSLRAQGFDSGAIAAKAGIQPFLVQRNIRQAGNFTLPQLRNAIEAAADAETKIKTGYMADRVAVELLIVEYGMQNTQK